MIGRLPTVLAIGAHTDDIELGCGASLSRYLREGASVSALTFSRAEDSVPPGMPVDTLELEHQASMNRLGIVDYRVHRFQVRNFDSNRQHVLDLILAAARIVQPDIVFTHSTTDTHQDHQVVSAESIRAFRSRTLYGYELPWNQRESVTNHFVEIAEEDLVNKQQSLNCYRSQVTLGRSYFRPSYSQSLAEIRGIQNKMKLAEAFETISSSRPL